MNKTTKLFTLFLLTLLAFALTLLWWPNSRNNPQGQLQAASKAIYPEMQIFPEPYHAEMAFALVASAPEVQVLLGRDELSWVLATPLGQREARPWATSNCLIDTCAHLVGYNMAEGGTVEAVVNLTQGKLVQLWESPSTRPVGSFTNLPQALAIAGQDEGVTAVLGDITQADLMMIPMNTWFLNDACAEDWCLDLTFHDPAGSGQIFHVTVNMQSQEVQRTFYSRARDNRPYRDLVPQRNVFNDGCQEQYGWEVCWEMTAHDGVNFYDARYNGTEIFSSAKIGQVEVWYPSWPGGYRDEIGHSASVPPYFGTTVTDLGDGFMVSQLFTEFTRWPNCICCYRYEQIMVFKEDGAFEANFVSHGPGCEDLSVYQPLWRIDMTLGTPAGGDVYLWQENAWVEATREQETSFLPDVSPEGHKLATFSGDLHYRWRYLPLDPLGLDDAKLFLLRGQEDENEGDGPILPGQANTFEPPRQWLDDEPLSGEHFVVWYVPLLTTKKGGPWWCMPDPAPEVSPCTAVLRIEPAGDLPTAVELQATLTAQAQTTPTPQPTPTRPAPAPTPAEQTPPTSEPEAQDDPVIIMQNAGCFACHIVGPHGTHSTVGPDLTDIATIASERLSGMKAREYVRRSILYPNEFIAPACPEGPCLGNIMPNYYGERLTANELELVLDYLLAGEWTVAQEEIEAETEAPTTTPNITPTAPDTPQPNPAPTSPYLWLIIGIPLLLLFLLWLAKKRG
jgi:hypothetical protein